MKVLRVSTVLIALAFTAPVLGGPIDDEIFARGWRAYKNEIYPFALELLTPLAERGHDTSQYIVGLMYVQGLGVDLNYDMAFKWFKLAAEQGETQAQTHLGLMYYNVDGLTRDYESAIKWFRLAAENGNSRAQFGTY